MEIPDRLVLGPGRVQSYSDNVESWKAEHSFPGRNKRIVSTPKVPDRLWILPSPLSSGSERRFKVVRRVKLTIHLHLVNNLSMFRATPLFLTGIYCVMASASSKVFPQPLCSDITVVPHLILNQAVSAADGVMQVTYKQQACTGKNLICQKWSY
jgi:hypothetical protein